MCTFQLHLQLIRTAFSALKLRVRINPIYAPIHLSLSTSRSLSLQSSLCSACLASIARSHIRELSLALVRVPPKFWPNRLTFIPNSLRKTNAVFLPLLSVYNFSRDVRIRNLSSPISPASMRAQMRECASVLVVRAGLSETTNLDCICKPKAETVRRLSLSFSLSDSLLCFWFGRVLAGYDRYANTLARAHATHIVFDFFSSLCSRIGELTGSLFPYGGIVRLSVDTLSHVVVSRGVYHVYARKYSRGSKGRLERMSVLVSLLTAAASCETITIMARHRVTGLKGAAGKEAIMRYDVWRSLSVPLVSVTHRLTRGQESTLTSWIFG